MKPLNAFLNESKRISSNDGVFYSADEILNDWRKNGYNPNLNIEEMCKEFDKGYDDFVDEIKEKITSQDLVLMMTKIHYPPIANFEPYDFIECVCKTSSKLVLADDDVENEFDVEKYQEYTFGDNYEGTVQLCDDLEDKPYGYTTVKDFDAKNYKGISPVIDSILKKSKAGIYYADRMKVHSYIYESNDLYINSNRRKEYVTLYAAELECEGSPDVYLILTC